MISPYVLFLNSIDNRYKVLDTRGYVYGDGETPEEAIASAEIVGVKPEEVVR